VNQLVVDCSVTMAWCFEDERNPYADAVLSILDNSEGLVPSIWPLEVANVLALSERAGRLDVARSAWFIRFLNDLPIRVDDRSSSHAFGETLALARAHDLTVYDASYLEVALRAGGPLATQDKALKNAAVKLGVAFVAS
jgi:predicted nucleic acid-binding protein